MKSKRRNAVLPTIQAWPAEGLEEIKKCPVCNGLERRRIYTGLTDRVFRCARGYWDVYQCNACQTAYLDPRPTEATISMAYETYYTHKSPKEKKLEDVTFLRRMQSMFVNGYRNRCFGSNLKPASRVAGILLSKTPLISEFLDRQLRFLPPVKPGGRLLDVGAGNGDFLLLARRIGWQASGVDIDPVAAENAYKAGIEVRQGRIEAVSDLSETFDVITMSHVLEHVHDPAGTLLWAYAALKPGGVLYIETPNIDAYGHFRFKEHWRGLEIPRHLVLFNWQSMIELLEKAGFQKCICFPIAWTYASMAAKSRAMQSGCDPYLSARPRLVDKLISISWFGSFLRAKNESEFITLIAHK